MATFYVDGKPLGEVKEVCFALEPEASPAVMPDLSFSCTFDLPRATVPPLLEHLARLAPPPTMGSVRLPLERGRRIDVPVVEARLGEGPSLVLEVLAWKAKALPPLPRYRHPARLQHRLKQRWQGIRRRERSR